MTHQLQRRKREEPVGELGNVARHERGLTHWRGGRGRRGGGSLETGKVENGVAPGRGKKKRRGLGGWRGRGEGGGVGWGAWENGASQTRGFRREGRKREERVGELGNLAGDKGGLTAWREEEGGAGW